VDNGAAKKGDKASPTGTARTVWAAGGVPVAAHQSLGWRTLRDVADKMVLRLPSEAGKSRAAAEHGYRSTQYRSQ